MTIDQLKENMVALSQQCNEITELCEAENREMTADEKNKMVQLTDKFEDYEEQLDLLEKQAKQNELVTRGTGRKTKPDTPGSTTLGTTDDCDITYIPHKEPARLDTQRGKAGFRHFGEMALSVAHAAGKANHPSSWDPRLRKLAATTFGTEHTGAEGGFAVPPDFVNEIQTLVMGEDSLAARCRQMTCSGNTLTIPKDEDTDWNVSTGVIPYWIGEGIALTETKPLLEESTIKLNKLSCLVKVTEELLEDAPAMGSYIMTKAPRKMTFALNLAIVQGNGGGQPLGILNGGDLVEVAKEGSQAADTVLHENIVKMWSRCYAPSRRNAVWLINQDVEPQLNLMQHTSASALIPSYMPPGGLSVAPYGTLMGRPVIPTQACETVGDAGDIILADLTNYLIVTKTSGMRSDTSMHLHFDQDIMSYRFILRVAGQPLYSSTISPRDGSTTLASFVDLAARA